MGGGETLLSIFPPLPPPPSDSLGYNIREKKGCGRKKKVCFYERCRFSSRPAEREREREKTSTHTKKNPFKAFAAYLNDQRCRLHISLL